jgi:carbon storage regulator
MLVLSRRTAETVVFPELGITVEVLQVKGNTIRLGIKAPDSVRILRGELDEVRKEFETPNQPATVSCDSASFTSELTLSVA